MTPEEAVKMVWPAGNPNINAKRVSQSIPKVLQSLSRKGFCCSLHGSYIHLAMEIIAKERGLTVSRNAQFDVVTLKSDTFTA